MKRTQVIAFEDRSRTEGGHATLVVRGVRAMPEPVTFALRLIDPIDSEDGQAAIAEDLAPLESRITDDGLELTVGPDVTELAELGAGTAVEIVLSGAGVKGEFLWPDVTPVARPKRRNRLARSTGREAAALQGIDLGMVMSEAAPIDFTGLEALAKSAPEDAGRPETSSGQARATDLPQAPEPAPEKHRAALRPAPAETGRVEPIELKPSAPLSPLPEPQLPARRRMPDPGVPAEEARHGGPPFGRSWATFAAAIVAGVLALQGALIAAMGGSFAGLSGAASGRDEPAAKGAHGGGGASLYALLAPGERSPAKVEGRGVTGERALALAAEHLQGAPEKRNTAEGAFWLRRYLAERLGDTTAMKALTQLGSSLAEPSLGQPDYAGAHRVWEIAAAYGDPVAMCFLAALNANGLGVPLDRPLAERWQQRAAAAGGACAAK